MSTSEYGNLSKRLVSFWFPCKPTKKGTLVVTNMERHDSGSWFGQSSFKRGHFSGGFHVRPEPQVALLILGWIFLDAHRTSRAYPLHNTRTQRWMVHNSRPLRLIPTDWSRLVASLELYPITFVIRKGNLPLFLSPLL